MNYEEFCSLKVGDKVCQGERVGTIVLHDCGSSLEHCEIHVQDLDGSTAGFSIFPDDYEIVKAKPTTIKTKFWVYLKNLGDGSVAARCFKSEKSAERYASFDNERYSDDVYEKSLEFDLEGNLVTPEPIHYNDR